MSTGPWVINCAVCIHQSIDQLGAPTECLCVLVIDLYGAWNLYSSALRAHSYQSSPGSATQGAWSKSSGTNRKSRDVSLPWSQGRLQGQKRHGIGIPWVVQLGWNLEWVTDIREDMTEKNEPDHDGSNAVLTSFCSQHRGRDGFWDGRWQNLNYLSVLLTQKLYLRWMIEENGNGK